MRQISKNARRHPCLLLGLKHKSQIRSSLQCCTSLPCNDPPDRCRSAGHPHPSWSSAASARPSRLRHSHANWRMLHGPLNGRRSLPANSSIHCAVRRATFFMFDQAPSTHIRGRGSGAQQCPTIPQLVKHRPTTNAASGQRRPPILTATYSTDD